MNERNKRNARNSRYNSKNDGYATKKRIHNECISSTRAKKLKKEKSLNKSKVSIVATLLLFTIIGTKALVTYFKTKEVSSLIQMQGTETMLSQAGKLSTRVDWIETTEEDGSKKEVPVPKGFSASRIPGENTVNGGFVIYEINGDDGGAWTKADKTDLDWDKILPQNGKEAEEQMELKATRNALRAVNMAKEDSAMEDGENKADKTSTGDGIENNENSQNELNKGNGVNLEDDGVNADKSSNGANTENDNNGAKVEDGNAGTTAENDKSNEESSNNVSETENESSKLNTESASSATSTQSNNNESSNKNGENTNSENKNVTSKSASNNKSSSLNVNSANSNASEITSRNQSNLAQNISENKNSSVENEGNSEETGNTNVNGGSASRENGSTNANNSNTTNKSSTKSGETVPDEVLENDSKNKSENNKNETNGEENKSNSINAETNKANSTEGSKTNKAEANTANIDGIAKANESAIETEADEAGIKVYSNVSEWSDEEKNIFDLQKTHNQYVWVPINNAKDLYGIDSNGKLWGKLRSFDSSGTSANNWEEIEGIMNINNVTGYREPDITKYRTDYDIDLKLNGYLYGETQYELLSKEIEQDFYNMIKSIEKYGGFYIGRYETGRLGSSVTSQAVVRKMNTNIADITWYYSYKSCKQLNGGNENIVTSLISGTLWDATLVWLVESGAKDSEKNLIGYSGMKNSINWGNYYNNSINYIDTSGEEKTATGSTRIPSGSSDYTKANNIYDLAGNVWEWTLEANSTSSRFYRGGFYNNYGDVYPASFRNDYYNPTFNSYDVSRRFSFILLY